MLRQRNAELNSQLASTFKAVCMAELEALKPGNVHIFADGHGMTIEHFMTSADVASQVIALANMTVGERILSAVKATKHAVNMNTNLGIILLSAPMIHTALNRQSDDFIVDLKQVLRALTIEDASFAFAAIRLANPAGLGEVAQNDVNDTAHCTLLQAMQTATHRDMIAMQYAHDFQDILSFGVPRYQTYLKQWQRPAWAATAVYLGFMARYADSHIARKHGEIAAQLVQNLAQQHEAEFVQSYNPKNYLTPLLHFDTDLKSQHLNPGTSADLTVATLLLHQFVLDKPVFVDELS